MNQTELKRLLDYDPLTGIFTAKIDRGNLKVGGQQGSLTLDGYLELRIHDKLYKAHRLAWLWVYGYFPENLIDHKNGDKLDNRIDNLRETTKACNSQNSKIYCTNTTGYKGVCYHKRTGRWLSQVHFKGRGIYIGAFDSSIEAALARLTWEDWCCDWSCDCRNINRKKVLADAGLLWRSA